MPLFRFEYTEFKKIMWNRATLVKFYSNFKAFSKLSFSPFYLFSSMLFCLIILIEKFFYVAESLITPKATVRDTDRESIYIKLNVPLSVCPL